MDGSDDFGLGDALDGLGDEIAASLLAAGMTVEEMMGGLPAELLMDPSAIPPDACFDSVGPSGGAGATTVRGEAGTVESKSDCELGKPPASATLFRSGSAFDGVASIPIQVVVYPKAVYAWIGPAVPTNVDASATMAAKQAMGGLLVATPSLSTAEAAFPPVTTIIKSSSSASMELESCAQRLVRKLKRVVLLAGDLPDVPDAASSLPYIERTIIGLVG